MSVRDAAKEVARVAGNGPSWIVLQYADLAEQVNDWWMIVTVRASAVRRVPADDAIGHAHVPADSDNPRRKVVSETIASSAGQYVVIPNEQEQVTSVWLVKLWNRAYHDCPVDFADLNFPAKATEKNLPVILGSLTPGGHARSYWNDVRKTYSSDAPFSSCGLLAEMAKGLPFEAEYFAAEPGGGDDDEQDHSKKPEGIINERAGLRGSQKALTRYQAASALVQQRPDVVGLQPSGVYYITEVYRFKMPTGNDEENPLEPLRSFACDVDRQSPVYNGLCSTPRLVSIRRLLLQQGCRFGAAGALIAFPSLPALGTALCSIAKRAADNQKKLDRVRSFSGKSVGDEALSVLSSPSSSVFDRRLEEIIQFRSDRIIVPVKSDLFKGELFPLSPDRLIGTLKTNDTSPKERFCVVTVQTRHVYTPSCIATVAGSTGVVPFPSPAVGKGEIERRITNRMCYPLCGRHLQNGALWNETAYADVCGRFKCTTTHAIVSWTEDIPD